ncbi:hypothetical protein ACFGVR_01725 [Mucilaginibacter sp. AW1-3]
MGNVAFILILVVPVLQLVLSFYRARHKIIIPVALTGILALIAGAGITYWAQYLDNPAALNFDDKKAPQALVLYWGLAFIAITSVLITLIFTIAYYIKRERVMRRKRKAAKLAQQAS